MKKTLAFLSSHKSFAFFIALYFIFLYPLMSLQKGFVAGDYAWQIYPQSFFYTQAIRQGFLPLWTDLLQSGFSIFEEGQTAMLYFWNLFLFKFFPFKIAYNLLFLVHFLMGGGFSYLLARRLRMSSAASTLVALCFTFGSAYAGFFYGIFSARTLVWFPLCLYSVEVYLENKRAWPLFVLALAQGQAWLGGYPQTAAYSLGFTALYYGLRTWGRRFSFRNHLLFLGALGLSFLIGWPQLWGMAELGARSTRVLQDREFVLWGSAWPWSAVTLLLYPFSGFLRANLYIGVFAFLMAVLSPAKKEWVWWVLAIVGYLLALGAFNPLYWVLLKVPFASLLRNPSKFLFFTAFSLSILAGFSFDRLAGRLAFWSQEELLKFCRRGVWLLGAFFLLVLLVFCLLYFWGEGLLGFGNWYVENFVLNRSFHRWPSAVYFTKVRDILAIMRGEVHGANIFLWVPFLLGVIFLGSLWMGKKNTRLWKAFILLGLVADLFLYGKFHYGTGFVGNMAPFPGTAALSRYPRDGRWADLTQGENPLFPPNRNLLSGHPSAGVYSPLADKNYYLQVKPLGLVDDSFGRGPFSPKAFEESRPLVNFLGIRYIVVDENARLETFPVWEVRDKKVIHHNPDAQEEFTLQGRSPQKLAESLIRVLKNQPQRALVETHSSQPAILVRNQLYHSGWKVWVDGFKTPLEKVGVAFQGVHLPAGTHRVEWVFRPDSFIIGRWVFAVGLFGALAGLFLSLGRGMLRGRSI